IESWLSHNKHVLSASRRSISLFVLILPLAWGQGTVPTFPFKVGQSSYTLVGRDPALGGTTKIRTVLIPVQLCVEAKKMAMDAAMDVPRVLQSPVFANFSVPS